MYLDILLNFVIPYIILIIGVASNIVIILVFRRQKFKKTLPRNYFCIMSIMDALSLITISPYHLAGYNGDILVYSEFTCKFITFTGYFLPAVSTWMLVLINAERLMSVYFKYIRIFGQFRFQVVSCGLIFLWNFVIYYSFASYMNFLDGNGKPINTSILNSSSSSSSKIYCDQYPAEAALVFSWLDLVNSSLLPFILMLLMNLSIVFSIYKTRQKICNTYDAKHFKNMRRSNRVSVMIISMSIAFFVFNFPVCLSYLLYYVSFIEFCIDGLGNMVIQIIFYLQYIFNIFVYFILYADFRYELLIMLKLKQRKKPKLRTKKLYRKVYI